MLRLNSKIICIKAKVKDQTKAYNIQLEAKHYYFLHQFVLLLTYISPKISVTKKKEPLNFHLNMQGNNSSEYKVP